MTQLEEEYMKHKESEDLEKQLRNQINDLEDQLSDKNKVRIIFISY